MKRQGVVTPLDRIWAWSVTTRPLTLAEGNVGATVARRVSAVGRFRGSAGGKEFSMIATTASQPGPRIGGAGCALQRIRGTDSVPWPRCRVNDQRVEKMPSNAAGGVGHRPATPTTGSVLDIACIGFFTFKIAERGLVGRGADTNTNALATAQLQGVRNEPPRAVSSRLDLTLQTAAILPTVGALVRLSGFRRRGPAMSGSRRPCGGRPDRVVVARNGHFCATRSSRNQAQSARHPGGACRAAVCQTVGAVPPGTVAPARCPPCRV